MDGTQYLRRIGTPVEATAAYNSGKPVARFVRASKGGKPENVYKTKLVPIKGSNITLATPGSQTMYQYGAASLASSKNNINPDKPATQIRHDYANQQLRIQEQVLPGSYNQQEAAWKYGMAKLKGLETHHVTEVNTGGRLLNALPNTASKTKVVRNALGDGIYFSDHKRNQARLFGSSKNFPGGQNMELPAGYSGIDEHDGAHQMVRKLAGEYNLPDARVAVSHPNSIETRMAGLPTTLAKEHMANAMFQLGRMGVQKQQFTKGGTRELTHGQAKALDRSHKKVQGHVNHVEAEKYYAGYMRNLGLDPEK